MMKMMMKLNGDYDCNVCDDENYNNNGYDNFNAGDDGADNDDDAMTLPMTPNDPNDTANDPQ